MSRAQSSARVGELRPSQLLFSFGVGANVDLPNLSAMVMGLDDWDTTHAAEIWEERLLSAVREELGGQVERLYSPPQAPDQGGLASPFEGNANVGVPVAAFPRWMLCPYCRLLAPLKSGLFQLKANPYRPDRTAYLHTFCPKPGKALTVLPARFLLACERGHLDDFPWVSFVHKGKTDCKALLRLREYGVSGEAADVEVRCDTCGARRRMSDAFGREGESEMPPCAGRLPHLRSYDEEGCEERMKPILLGASNLWFPVTLSTLAIPTKTDRLGQLVDANWATVKAVTSLEVLKAFKDIGQLNAFVEYDDDKVWAEIQAKREGTQKSPGEEAGDLKSPEWTTFSHPEQAESAPDFRLRQVAPPRAYQDLLSDVVLVERLREVRALVGFTRIGSPGDFNEAVEVPAERRVALSRRPPRWAPASEVRGEGIFLRFDEAEIVAWCATEAAREREKEFFEAHRRCRSVELVWTGPAPRGTTLRRTDQALLELVHTAERTLYVVTFAAYKVPAVKEAMLAAAKRGVDITLIFESPDTSAGKTASAGLEALGDQLRSLSEVYLWPLEKRPKDPAGRHGSLHAKCAVADGSTLLTPCASFSERLNKERDLLLRSVAPKPAEARRRSPLSWILAPSSLPFSASSTTGSRENPSCASAARSPSSPTPRS